MNEYLTVLILAALPALGNFAGGLLAEAFSVSQRRLSLALHGAAGVVLAVVGVELMPQALQADPPWLIVLAFATGGVTFMFVDRAIGLAKSRTGDANAHGARIWAIFLGVAVDLFSDGLMIGTGSTITLSLGLLLALGQVTADVPEGFATIAAFKRQGMPRYVRLLLAVSFALPVLLGATLGYWIVRDQAETVKLALLAFTAGILTTVTVEEIIPESHRDEEARLATLVFVGGFALFTLLSIYFE